MKQLIFIFGFVTWFLVGCYDDKGNYDYKEVNTIEGLSFMPEPIVVEEGNSYRYEYRQPSQEELKVIYSPGDRGRAQGGNFHDLPVPVLQDEGDPPGV